MLLEWQFFLDDDGSGRSYLEWLLAAWGWTFSVALCAWFVAMLFGCTIGVMRTLPTNKRMNLVWIHLSGYWVEIFRNIPLLVQIFLWYFVLPKIFPALQAIPGFVLVVFGLGFFTSARIAEMLRAGIQALPRGQRDAALALGFNTWQSYRHVLLPMAFRTVWPPLTSETMNLLKNSSVAFAVSIAELTMYAMQVQEETSRGIEVYLAVTALYTLTAFSVNRLMAYLEKKIQIPGLASPVQLTDGR